MENTETSYWLVSRLSQMDKLWTSGVKVITFQCLSNRNKTDKNRLKPNNLNDGYRSIEGYISLLREKLGVFGPF